MKNIVEKLAVLICPAVLLLCCSAATASSGIGETHTPAFACGSSGYTHLQNSTGHAPAYTAPFDGVITSWSHFANDDATTSLKLKVLRPTATAGEYMVVGESATQLVTPSTLNRFPTRIPVHAGDIIGLSVLTGSAPACIFSTSDAGDSVRQGPADPAVGTTQAFDAPQNYRVNVAAVIDAPPTSAVSVPGCSQNGSITASVTADSDTSAKALHYKVDGSGEQVAPTVGNPGSATISLPEGHHNLEYWGEDQLGQQEATHHTTAVTVDHSAPTVSITSDQHRNAYAAGKPASITTAAADTIDNLTANPSRVAEALSTMHAGTFSVSKTAIDQCTNSATAIFRYTVAPTDTTPRVSPATFRAAASGASIATRPKTGTTISYATSDAGRTSFVVLQALPGVRHGKRCVTPPRTGKAKGHPKRCTRYMGRGSFTHNDKAGSNRFRFTGRVGGHKLARGSYQLDATPLAAGIKGSTVSTRFRIKR